MRATGLRTRALPAGLAKALRQRTREGTGAAYGYRKALAHRQQRQHASQHGPACVLGADVGVQAQIGHHALGDRALEMAAAVASARAEGELREAPQTDRVEARYHVGERQRIERQAIELRAQSQPPARQRCQAVSILPKLAGGAIEIAAEGGARPAGLDVRALDGCVQPAQPGSRQVMRQKTGAHRAEREEGRPGVVLETGLGQLPGGGRAAELGLRLEEQRFETGLREGRRRGETVGSRSHDDRVETHGEPMI